MSAGPAASGPAGAPPRAVGRNVFLLGLTSFFGDVASEMVVPLLPAFLVLLGGGALFVATVEGTAEATSALFKVLSGRAADRVRRMLPLAFFGYGVSAASRTLLALAGAPWQVLALRCADRVGKGVRTPPRDKLLAQSAPDAALAEAFSFHRGMDHLGAALGPLGAAALLWFFPGQVRRVFLLAALPGALAMVALFFVREAGTAQLEALPPSAAAGRPAASAALPARGAGAGETDGTGVPPGLLVAIGLFTLGNSADALLLLRAQALGVPAAQLPLLWTLLHSVRALLSWPLGRAADRLGRRGALAVGWCWYALCYAGFALGAAPAHAWALFAAYGVTAGLTEGSERALVAASVPERRRGAALGLYSLVSGLGLLAASLLAGEVWEHVSPEAALGTGAALAGLAAALLVTLGGRAAAPARVPPPRAR